MFPQAAVVQNSSQWLQQHHGSGLVFQRLSSAPPLQLHHPWDSFTSSYHNVLHLCSAQPVPTDVNDVIQPSRQLVIAFTSAIHTIPSEEEPCRSQNRAVVSCYSKNELLASSIPTLTTSLSVPGLMVSTPFSQVLREKVGTFSVILLPVSVPAPSSGSCPNSAVCWLKIHFSHPYKPGRP